LKFVPGPLPEQGFEPTQATPQGPPPATLEQARQAAEWASEIEDEELRKIVEKTARSSLARASG
jgi:hypothetical protein